MGVAIFSQHSEFQVNVFVDCLVVLQKLFVAGVLLVFLLLLVNEHLLQFPVVVLKSSNLLPEFVHFTLPQSIHSTLLFHRDLRCFQLLKLLPLRIPAFLQLLDLHGPAFSCFLQLSQFLLHLPDLLLILVLNLLSFPRLFVQLAEIAPQKCHLFRKLFFLPSQLLDLYPINFMLSLIVLDSVFEVSYLLLVLSFY